MSEISDRGAPSIPLGATRVGHGVARGLAATMPVLLVGTMAMTALGLVPTAPIQRARANSAEQKKSPQAPSTTTIDVSSAPVSDSSAESGDLSVAAVTPSSYTVRSGDTVSGIAARYGLSTASVLALNGLSWKSLIFPRQVLRLTKAATPVVVTPKAPTAPSAPSTVTASSTKTTYTILRGDTITSIAKKFGVSVQSILTANKLVATSIVYSGRTLVIPNATKTASVTPTTPVVTPPAGTQLAQVGTSTVVLTSSMAANAKIIIAVGKQLGVPSFGIVIALAAAAQESGLENLGYGDRDSVGLFQQRPSAGWGTVAQLENPTYAAQLFYGGPSNPNKGKTRGLLDIAGWQSMTLTQAAQAVQISATPTAYAKWEASARSWLAQLG